MNVINSKWSLIWKVSQRLHVVHVISHEIISCLRFNFIIIVQAIEKKINSIAIHNEEKKDTRKENWNWKNGSKQKNETNQSMVMNGMWINCD